MAGGETGNAFVEIVERDFLWPTECREEVERRELGRREDAAEEGRSIAAPRINCFLLRIFWGFLAGNFSQLPGSTLSD